MTKQTFQAAEVIDDRIKQLHFDKAALERDMGSALDEHKEAYQERIAVKRSQIEDLQRQFEEL